MSNFSLLNNPRCWKKFYLGIDLFTGIKFNVYFTWMRNRGALFYTTILWIYCGAMCFIVTGIGRERDTPCLRSWNGIVNAMLRGTVSVYSLFARYVMSRGLRYVGEHAVFCPLGNLKWMHPARFGWLNWAYKIRKWHVNRKIQGNKNCCMLRKILDRST